MNILFCRWNGCAEIGLMHAFLRMGHHIDECMYAFAGTDYSEECLNLLRKKLDGKRYDMVFSQNFVPIISKVCQIYKVIYISWVMDSPAHQLYSHALENTYNRVFIFDHHLYERFAGKNPGHIFYYPLATCVSEWEQAFKRPHPDRDLSADVSFLGSLYIRECNYDDVENVPAYVKGYLDGLIEAQLHVYGYHFLEEILPPDLVESYAFCADWMQPEDYVSDKRAVTAQEYLSKKISQIERIRISEALAASAYEYKLYTNSPVPKRLKSCYHGVCGYYDEMPWAFRESKINLNITAKGIESGLPLRLFDIMGAGGFVLTNYQSELPDYFDIGSELAVYESIPHLLSQVDYYLSHEEERAAIARRGYEKVKTCFTYDIALTEMIHMVF